MPGTPSQEGTEVAVITVLGDKAIGEVVVELILKTEEKCGLLKHSCSVKGSILSFFSLIRKDACIRRCPLSTQGQFRQCRQCLYGIGQELAPCTIAPFSPVS
jgi:hypothetical protein